MTNTVILIGRWTREHSYTEGSTTVFKNTIAVDHPYKKDDPSFIQVVFFGKSAELANQYTQKGSQVAIEGHIQTGKYTNQEGKTIYTTDVIGNRIKFLDSKNASNNQSEGAQQYSQSNTPNQQQNAQNRTQGGYNDTQNYDDPFNNQGGPVHVSDDDLPF